MDEYDTFTNALVVPVIILLVLLVILTLMIICTSCDNDNINHNNHNINPQEIRPEHVIHVAGDKSGYYDYHEYDLYYPQEQVHGEAGYPKLH